VIFVSLIVVRVRVTVVLKDPFLGWRSNYEYRLISSWTHLFRSTSFGKQCTSYNAPPTSRKHAADYLPELLITSKFLASELLFHGWKSPEIAETAARLIASSPQA
jgi:hypothetical protein